MVYYINSNSHLIIILILKSILKCSYLQNQSPNEDEITQIMLNCAQNFVPSIHKTLDFVTMKPKSNSIGGLVEVKNKLNKVVLSRRKLASVYHKYRIKPPNGKWITLLNF